MSRSRPITLLAGPALIALSAMAIAACGGGAKVAPAPPKTASGDSATVGVANSGLGTILVDSTGRTLYLFKKDSGTTSACTGACAAAWPPLLAHGKPTVGSGADASLVGTATRPGGQKQVTYNRHPLYLFVKDQNPGDVNGQGVSAFGASWFALSAAGNQDSAQQPTSSVGGGGSSGGY